MGASFADWNVGACLYGFQLLKSGVLALFVAGMSRVFLICFGVHYWFVSTNFIWFSFLITKPDNCYHGSHSSFCIRYLGHCISYAVVASVLLGAAVMRHLSATDPFAARRDALQSTVIRLREGFRRKEPNSSSSSSDGCGSSMKRSSSVEAGHLGNVVESTSKSGPAAQCTVDGNNWNGVLCRVGSSQEGINSDKSMDSGRPSLALRSSSCRSIIQEPDAAMSFVDKSFDQNSSLVVCSSSGLDSQGCESSTSTSANQQTLDLNLALALQERLSDPRITSMLKRSSRQGDRELANLLQNKGLDPNFAMMLKEKSLDPTILALLQRSSLDADREHRDNTDITIIDSNSVDNMLPNQISLSEELRLHGLEKWLQFSRLVLHNVAGTPERAWVIFSLVFIIETIIVAIFRPKTVDIINAKHQQVNKAFIYIYGVQRHYLILELPNL